MAEVGNHVVEGADQGLVEGTVVEGTKTYTKGGSYRERQKQGGRDTFSVTDRMRKDYGLRTEETPSWIRNPDTWERYEMSNRVTTFLDDYPAGRVVLHPKTKEPIRHGDLILAAYPLADKEDREAMLVERREELEDGLEPMRGEPGVATKHETRFHRPRTEAEEVEWKRMMRKQHEDHIAAGAIGPTSHLKLTEALRRQSTEEAMQEAAEWRGGPTHQEYDAKEFEKMQARVSEVVTDRLSNRDKGRGASFSVGAQLGASTSERVRARVGKGGK